MQEKHINLIINSFDRLENREGVVKQFYDELFDLYPELEALFVDIDLTQQRKDLVQSLTLIIQSLRNPAMLRSALSQMVDQNATDYHTQVSYFPMIGEALLSALSHQLGVYWTPEVENAWVMGYQALVDLMMQEPYAA